MYILTTDMLLLTVTLSGFNLKASVRSVGGWCEMAGSLRGREPESRGSSNVNTFFVLSCLFISSLRLVTSTSRVSQL
jgi:hypothetical protein